MTEYERGRRDAVRDVIVYLVVRAQDYAHYYSNEPEYDALNSAAKQVENFTALAPDGLGREYDK